MKPEIEEVMRKLRIRTRKIAELRAVIATLQRVTPKDERLVKMAQDELAELERHPMAK